MKNLADYTRIETLCKNLNTRLANGEGIKYNVPRKAVIMYVEQYPGIVLRTTSDTIADTNSLVNWYKS